MALRYLLYRRVWHLFVHRLVRVIILIKSSCLSNRFFICSFVVGRILRSSSLLGILVVIFLINPISIFASSAEEATGSIKNTDLGFLTGFAFGAYIGGERASGEIYPYESPDSAIGDPDILLAGIVFKYKYSFLMARTALEGGIPLELFGTGKNTAGEFSFSNTIIHIPFTFALNFPLRRNTALYMGMGPSYFQGIVIVKSPNANNTYNFSGLGINLLLGSEIAITDSGAFSFEWMLTFGTSASLKNANKQEREFSLNSSQILLGYSYYVSL